MLMCAEGAFASSGATTSILGIIITELLTLDNAHSFAVDLFP